MATFELNIITPEKQVLSDTVDFLVAPAVKGELGILPGHAHLLAQLTPGELRYKKGQETFHFAVSGGFIEVHPDRVMVFAEAAELAHEIDEARAKAAEERAKAALRNPSLTAADLDQAQATLKRASARLRVASEHRIPKRKS